MDGSKSTFSVLLGRLILDVEALGVSGYSCSVLKCQPSDCIALLVSSRTSSACMAVNGTVVPLSELTGASPITLMIIFTAFNLVVKAIAIHIKIISGGERNESQTSPTPREERYATSS